MNYRPELLMRPFLQPDTTLPEPRVPDDLEELFCKGSQLKRYVYAEGDYPYIFNDDVCAHTIRCIWTVDVLELPSFLDGDRIRRMFWIHDLPEAIAHEDIGHDMTSGEKMNNPTEARLIVDRENEAAKQFLSETDYQLFVDFEHASGAIKSLDPLAFTGDSPSMEGVVGKLIDATVDGSGAFNTFVTDWIRSDAFDPDLPFPPSYGFEYDRNFAMSRLKKLYDFPDSPLRDVLIYILRERHFPRILELWSDIDLTVLPEYIGENRRDFFAEIEHILHS